MSWTIPILIAASTLVAAVPASAAPASVDAMRGARRVLILSAPDAADARLKAQRSTLAMWREGADERDLTIVELVGERTEGASDAASTLRTRYGLPDRGFSATLIGKDGHVALRSREPIGAANLQGTIDAMPMRRAGQR